MNLDRRQLLAAGGVCLASCGAIRLPGTKQASALDLLLAAHADVLPEALEALGHEAAIDDSWRRGAAGYAGEFPRVAPIADPADAFGAYDRFGDWLDCFTEALRREPWRSVIARWAPRLAPGISAAAFHGVIRTGHAARALRRRETSARTHELAVGLAYWAARYTELPTTPKQRVADESFQETLAGLEHPWLHEDAPVDFFAVLDRLTQMPIARPITPAKKGSTAQADLDVLVRDAAAAFLEMLILERYRIWLLHTVTGPAAVGLLLPEVDEAGARKLVEYARQAVLALYAAYGAPFVARAHVRAAPPAWPTLIQRAVDSRSVHTIKLTEALVRFERDDDPLWRTVAAQWLEWV